MKIFNVIMAGGGGTRFWPLSRQEHPKQLLNLSGDDALINETIKKIITQISEKNAKVILRDMFKSYIKRYKFLTHVLSTCKFKPFIFLIHVYSRKKDSTGAHKSKIRARCPN